MRQRKMNKINKMMIAALFSTMASFSFADASTDADQKIDRYSQLCLAVLKSEQEFVQTARSLGITKNERDRLVCNDMNLDQFASTFRLTDQNTIAAVQ